MYPCRERGREEVLGGGSGLIKLDNEAAFDLSDPVRTMGRGVGTLDEPASGWREGIKVGAA